MVRSIGVLGVMACLYSQLREGGERSTCWESYQHLPSLPIAARRRELADL